MTWTPPKIDSIFPSTVYTPNGIMATLVAKADDNNAYIYISTINSNNKPYYQWYKLPPIQDTNQDGQIIEPPLFPYDSANIKSIK